MKFTEERSSCYELVQPKTEQKIDYWNIENESGGLKNAS